MSMSEWAEEECKIACKKENPDWDGKSFDYGCSCYQSALKAYKSLCEDGHSGFSFNMTKKILIRLMNELPLTPIEDKEGEWEMSYKDEDGSESFQCKRMSSLFKHVDKDGTVFYSDCNRDYCQEVTNPKDTYSGGVGRIIDELFPITMPYYPKTADKYKIVVDTFLAEGFEGDNTDYNTKAILYVITPEKEKVEVNRYYGEKEGEMVEITRGEYNKRLENRKTVKEIKPKLSNYL